MLSLTPITDVYGILRRLTGLLYSHKLSVADWDNACPKLGVTLHERDEGRHLLGMGSRIINDQQAAGAKHAPNVCPPTGILDALGIEKNEIECLAAQALKDVPGFFLDERDHWRRPVGKICGCELVFELRAIYRRNRASDVFGGLREPESRLPVGRADPSTRRADIARTSPK